MEQKLDITTNDKGYKNIGLKPRPLKGIKGIDNGNYVIVEKKYTDGREIQSKFGKSFSCVVLYEDQEVSFFLNEKEHEQYKNCGGIGDKIKISLKEEPFINKKTGVKSLLNKLSFEKVQ